MGRIHTIPLGSLLCTLVLSCGGGGGSGNSTATTPPDPPGALKVEKVEYDLQLSWSGAAGATHYEVYGSSLSGVPVDPDHLVATTDDTKVVLIGGPPGAPIHFVVTAHNDAGQSEPSEELVTAWPNPDEDALFTDQWHLENLGQEGGTVGEDANVVPLWHGGSSGEGLIVAIVDDGMEIFHEDLEQNAVPGMSYDYLDGDTDPTGGFHGTCVAGVVGAVGDNKIGGKGAAPRVDLVAYNLLQNNDTVNQTDAMVRNAEIVAISNNSWGAPDGLGVPIASDQFWREAVVNGLDIGRGGLGTIYLWAAGNGHPDDNANLDGHANFLGVIAIAAVGDDGKRASYSEIGANVLVCAHSMGRDNHGITTTDRTGTEGLNDGDQPGDYDDSKYTKLFNGTSSSTPLASGALALVLETNPFLGWRDVRKVLALSARKNDPQDADWNTNGAGYDVNHKYGFGAVDAEAAAELATTWTNLPELEGVTAGPFFPGLPIPDNSSQGATAAVVIQDSGIHRIEFVRVTVNVPDHPWIGDLDIELTSPAGTVSKLAVMHDFDIPDVQYEWWSFTTVRHLDEPADGTWMQRSRDLEAGATGTFDAWALEVFGT